MGQQTTPRQGINYDRIVRDQMVGVVRRVLGEVAEGGLPPGNHFYLTFATPHCRGGIPGWLAARHPETITILLQHAFWDLSAGEDEVSVTLAFGGRRERLSLPYDALLGFRDPHVGFSLNLALPDHAAPEGAPEADGAAQAARGERRPVSEPRPDLGDNVVSVAFGRG